MHNYKKCSEQINSSEPLIKSPLKLLKEMKNDFLASRELSWRLFHRNISAQYRHSLLGFIWIFIPALVTAGIWTLLKSSNIINITEPEIPYPVFVLVGTLLWKCFAESISTPINSFLGAKNMLAKIDFPREALLISGLGSVVFNSLIRFIIIIIVMIFSPISFSASIILFPLAIFSLILLGTAIGTFLVPIGVLYHDVSRVLGFGIQFWFYLTPIVYPKPMQGVVAKLTEFNPVTPILTTGRTWLTGTGSMMLTDFTIITSASAILLFIGWIIIKLTLPHLIERISN